MRSPDALASRPEASAEQAGREQRFDRGGIQSVRRRAQGGGEGDEVLGSEMERELSESDVHRAPAALLDLAELGGDETAMIAGARGGLTQEWILQSGAPTLSKMKMKFNTNKSNDYFIGGGLYRWWTSGSAELRLPLPGFSKASRAVRIRCCSKPASQ